MAWSSLSEALRSPRPAPRGVPLHVRETWDRAKGATETFHYRRAKPLVLHDLDERDAYDEVLADPVGLRRAFRAVEGRAAERSAAAAESRRRDQLRVYRHRVGARIVGPAAVT